MNELIRELRDAIVEVAHDPNAAKRNADALKAIKAEQTVNKELIKELNVGNHALHLDREKLAEDRVQFDEDLADFAAARGDFADEMKSLAKQKRDASEEVSKRKDQLKVVENDFAKKFSIAESKLEAVNTQIRAAKDCKREVEEDLDRVRRMIG